MASTALATGITSSGGGTPTIKAEAEGHVVLDNPIATINCASAVEAKVESHGEGVTVKGNVSALSFTGCTNSWHVTVVAAGSLEVHHISGSSNGTVTSSGATIEATRFGVSCRYATSSTDVGRLTGSSWTGSKATLDIEAAIPFHSGSFLCGEGSTTWTGNYVVTSPTSLDVDAGNGGGGGEADGITIIGSPTLDVGDDTNLEIKNDSHQTFTFGVDSIDGSAVIRTGLACANWDLAATASCTTRSLKCVSAGTATWTAALTPGPVQLSFTVKCD